MKKLFRLVLFTALCLVVGCTTTTAPEAPVTMNVGTYNIWCQLPDWSTRSSRIAELVDFHEYDLVGMQEVLPLQLDTLLAKLPNYAAVGSPRDGVDGGEYSAILYLKDRFEVVDSATFWLSETPDTVSFGWDAMCRRVCTWGRFREKSSGKEFYYFNTHLDHMGVEARAGGVELISDRINQVKGEGLPIFCTGDFNAHPTDSPILTMKECLSRARELSKSKPYHAGAVNWSYVRDCKLPLIDDDYVREEIDYIFVNDQVEVLKFAYLTDSDGRTFPSDHLPVWARVTLK